MALQYSRDLVFQDRQVLLYHRFQDLALGAGVGVEDALGHVDLLNYIADCGFLVAFGCEEAFCGLYKLTSALFWVFGDPLCQAHNLTDSQSI